MQKSILTTAIAIILSGTTQVVYAIKPEPPSLLSPSNEKKVPLKDLKFTWTAPDNDATVKTKAYNVMISIYSDFHLNDKETCDSTGSGSCIKIQTGKTPKFTLQKTHPAFAFFNKKNTTFYWKVQAVGANGDFSKFSVGYKFILSDTLNIPKRDSTSIEPLSAPAGSSFTFTMFLTSELLSGYSAKVDYGDGWKTLKCTGVTCVTKAVINDVGEDKNAQFAIYDDKGIVTDSTPYFDNYSVTAADEIPAEIPPEEILNTPPTVTLVSGLDSVVKNSTYTLKLKANDSDGNLNRIEIDWLDGSKIDAKAATDGATLTFTHTYKFAGTYPLIATAIDNSNAISNELSKSLTVTEPAATATTIPPTVKVPSVSTLNALPASVTQGETVTFSTTLSANLPSGYSVKINYGNGLVNMNGSGKSFSLTATPSNSASYSIGVYDSKGVLKSNQLTSNFEITAPKPAPVVVAPPVTTTKTTGYTKIANNGTALPDSAKLGTAPTDWACTKDNKTGLIWEVKTDDDGLRDKDWRYSWNDSFSFATNVNTQGLCGATDWRLPTRDELIGLVYCSDGEYNKLTEESLNSNDYGYICKSNESNLTTTSPTINTTYFPNTQNNWFWSSSPYANVSYYAWIVNFYYGNSSNYNKSSNDNVRLVR